MALLDFLKNKKARDESVPMVKEKKSVKKVEKVSVAPKIERIAKTGFSYNIVKEPHISEKASILAEQDKYTFKVYANANKLEIKKSVQGVYGVDVLDVNMIKIPRKKRRLGRTEGYKKAFVKAVVTIKAGQKIEIL